MAEKNEARILIVEDDRALAAMLSDEIRDAGLHADWAASAEEGIKKMRQQWPDLVISDLSLPGMDGMLFLKEVLEKKQLEPSPAFLIITAFGTISKAVEALKAGAEDFLTKPLDLEHFILSVRRILERKQLRETLSRMRGFLSAEGFHGMHGQSTSMRLLFEQIRQVAKAQGPILILGESGSGKELVARAIHKESSRTKGPFIPVNCAGIPEHLMESEFFGHTAGAFTGASKNRPGLFAEASGGSLLLDEISEMPLFLQAKLLRILQDGKVRRVGENREDQVDVRILAATHQDMEKDVQQENFRKDLFFRLETFTLRVPPLREREEDKELLAARFMEQFALAMDKRIRGFSSSALDLITHYPFPGNVRELRNAMERAVTFAKGKLILPEDLPARIRNPHCTPSPIAEAGTQILPTDRLIPLAELELRYIRHVLKETGGNKRSAATILGIGRRTLYRKLGEG
ncbi:sigma-54-dependent transcriptional regulator [Desulfobotulus mexicanus]|uniref:Sigma-54-dependent Fis family transcriptional regulator n=1 Tax=Desulfobotulus mexicanus TaxID=2586642 RepID=A0A5S5MCN0_9BACT|nr:sigma-54 dependent transcriptional regulator [Desulfobotulus mexicanus]TYT73464.1 sigma-54-dependent Fis family transcriptional regulator [Desulfobotulus mexicanus]